MAGRRRGAVPVMLGDLPTALAQLPTRATSTSDRIKHAVDILSRASGIAREVTLSTAKEAIAVWDWIVEQHPSADLLRSSLESAGGWTLTAESLRCLLHLSGIGSRNNAETDQARRKNTLRLFFSWEIWPWELLGKGSEENSADVRSELPGHQNWSKPLLAALVKLNADGASQQIASKLLLQAYLARVRAQPRRGLSRISELLNQDVTAASKLYCKSTYLDISCEDYLLRAKSQGLADETPLLILLFLPKPSGRTNLVGEQL